MLLAQLEQDLLTAGDPCSTGLQCEVGGGDGIEDDLHEVMVYLVQFAEAFSIQCTSTIKNPHD